MQNKYGAPDTGSNGQANDDGTTAVAAVGAGASAVSREAHGFLADIEDLVKATTSLTGDDLTRAKAKLAQRITAAKASVATMSRAVVDGTRQAAQATDGMVRERPWQAIGIVAALGVLVGILIARRA